MLGGLLPSTALHTVISFIIAQTSLWHIVRGDKAGGRGKVMGLGLTPLCFSLPRRATSHTVHTMLFQPLLDLVDSFGLMVLWQFNNDRIIFLRPSCISLGALFKLGTYISNILSSAAAQV